MAEFFLNFVNLNYKMLKVLIVLKPFPLYNYFHSQKLDLFKHKIISTLKNWIYLKLLIAIFFFIFSQIPATIFNRWVDDAGNKY